MQQPKLGEIRKPAKTMSGVTPLTVVLKPRKCDHGTCIYCPGGDNVPQSYTDKSPAVMRALMLAFDPTKQVEVRLKAFEVMNHPTDKIELIILGGTFLQYPKKYKYNFIKSCFDALNNKKSKTLEQAKKINEKSKHRCVALCIENRPDNCSETEIKEMLDFGCTRVEIGVQMPDDYLYEKTDRGHTVEDVINATKRLKDSGFKVGYHIMPGLPFSNPKLDLKLFKSIFSKQDFRPDQLKIYPCQIIKDSPLEKNYMQLGYQPYDEDTTRKLLDKMIFSIPNYCRVMRVMREIPPDRLVEGLRRIDLRNEVNKDLLTRKSQVQEIRMREVGFNPSKNLDTKIKLISIKYKASHGEEFFLQYTNKKNILFALLRLRFPNKPFIKELEGCAIVRELHVYGKAIPIGGKGEIQHTGLGKALIKEAEDITKKAGYKKLAIISGVGVRPYYKKLGYNLQGDYMIKDL